MEKNSKIVSCYFTGLSRTHFNLPGGNHIWNGIALIVDGRVKDVVYIDAAFQMISTPAESGYVQRTVGYDAKSVTNIALNASAKVGRISIDENNVCHGDFTRTLVLGCSQDRKYVYSLAFCFITRVGQAGGSQESGVPSVVLSRINPDSSSSYFFFDPADSGDIRSSTLKEPLSPAEKAEITTLLHESSRITFSRDLEKYPHDRLGHTTSLS